MNTYKCRLIWLNAGSCEAPVDMDVEGVARNLKARGIDWLEITGQNRKLMPLAQRFAGVFGLAAHDATQHGSRFREYREQDITTKAHVSADDLVRRHMSAYGLTIQPPNIGQVILVDVDSTIFYEVEAGVDPMDAKRPPLVRAERVCLAHEIIEPV